MDLPLFWKGEVFLCFSGNFGASQIHQISMLGQSSWAYEKHIPWRFHERYCWKYSYISYQILFDWNASTWGFPIAFDSMGWITLSLLGLYRSEQCAQLPASTEILLSSSFYNLIFQPYLRMLSFLLLPFLFWLPQEVFRKYSRFFHKVELHRAEGKCSTHWSPIPPPKRLHFANLQFCSYLEF